MLDSWLEKFGPLIEHVVDVNKICNLHVSATDMVDNEGDWRWIEFDGSLLADILLHIAVVKPHLIKSAYKGRVRSVEDVVDKWWGMIAKFKGSSRLSTSFGSCIEGRFLQMENNYEGIVYLMCGVMVESILHVIRDCLPVIVVWSTLIKQRILLRCQRLVRKVVETRLLAAPTSTLVGAVQRVEGCDRYWVPPTEG
ncbi:hypothetical protein V6N13_106654 [Hibiscus sabdariffa]